ncbi:MAG TPA: hypothetical protein PKN02_10635 [Thermotogota bacterium]|nr:hypothetical protein [Thermotogota bacterium]
MKEEEEYGWEEPFDYAIENIGIHLYASKERPEKDTTIRERLVELFKKSFAGSETENLPKTILRKLLDFVVAHQDENNEIVFKRELSNFVKNQKEQENQDSLFSLAVFLRERSDSYMVRSKPKWGKWLLDYQHKLLEELISSNPEVDEYNYALAESLIRIGDYERISGNTEKAHEDYLESRDIMIGLIEKNPDNFDWKHCFLISSCREIETGIHFVPVGLNCLFMLPIDVLKLNKLEQFLTDYDKNTFLGALYNQKCGEVEGPKYGEHYFRESIRILKGLITSGNTNSEIQGMLIKNHIHLGDCKKETGDLNEASEEYQMALHLVEKQTEQDPENTEWKRARCESWSKIADVERERNNLDRAFRACEEALKIAKGLSKVNDSHAGWKRVLWENWTKVADIERERGNLYQGLDACRVSTRILEELIALDPSQDVLFREQGESWILMGELADRNANENVYLEAFSEAEKCFGICSRDFERVRGLKETFYRKAVIEKVRGNLTNSKVLFEKCLEIDPNNNYSPCSLYSYIGLGEIESAFGNPLSGLNYFKNALSILPKSCKDKELELLYRTVDSVNTLIKRTSYSLEGDSEFRNNLANCWNQIGDIEKRRGQMQKALSAYHKDLSLLRCDRYRDQFSALYKIAEIERDSIPEKSIKWYYEAVSVLNHKRVISQAILPEIIDALGKLVELIGQNERYVYLVEDIAGIWGKIGDYERTRKNYEKAAEYYRNYYNIFNELIINKNNDTEMKILAICRKIASFSKRIDKKDAAKEWYKLVNNRSRELLIRYPDSFELIISFVSSLINLYSLSEESEKKVAFYNEAYQFTNTLILSGNKIKTLNQLKAFFVGNSKNPGNEGD